MKKQNKTKEVMKLVNKWSERLGKDTSPSNQITNSFDHMLEMKELDGLSSTNPQTTPSSNGQFRPPHDPNKDDGIIVEWSTGEDERNSAIKETRDVLTGNSSVFNTTETDITEDDIPVDPED